MRRHLSMAGYVLALLGLVWLARECGYREGGKEALLRQAGAVTDSSARETDRLRADMVAREVERESTLARTGRELATARQTVARLRASLTSTPPMGGDSAETLRRDAVKDSVINAQADIIRQQDSVIVIWTARAEERGVLLRRALQERTAFQQQRDAWQRKAEPGILERIRRGLPYVVVGVVAWELAR